MTHNLDKIGIHDIDMPFFLDTQETSQRFGSYIAELRSLFDTNHIRHGSPDDIFEFAKVLESSNQFRLDLSVMVKSIVQKESGELLLTDMMSIIVASVGGPSFADTQADITKPTNALMEFLLGTGCWRQFGLPSSPTSQNSATQPKSAVRTEEPRVARFSSHISPPLSTANEESEDQTALLNASSELREMLARLEINTQQVKLHLDLIEQRLSRIQSVSKDLPAQMSLPNESLPQIDIPAPVVRETAQQSLAKEIPVFEEEVPTRNRAVFSHQPLPEQSRPSDVSSPTFAYATERGKSTLPVVAFLGLLVVLIAGLFFGYSSQGRILLKGGMSRLRAAGTHFSGGRGAESSTTAATLPPTSAPPPASVAAAPVVPPLAAPSATTRGIVETEPAHSTTSNSTNSNMTPASDSIPDSPQARYVPANVMEGYLLSAPRPGYPPLARINHIEGSVAMQATISRSGSIKTLHVIKGPTSLRSAAIDAVRYWRYKPYSVDGHPIEISTTIYVDFTLKAPPSLVQ